MVARLGISVKRTGPLFNMRETRQRARRELKIGVIEAQEHLGDSVLDRIPSSGGRKFGFNTGALKRSINPQLVQEVGDGFRGTVGSPLVHAPVIEDGRAPGSKPPPIAPIKRWLERKRIVPTANRRRHDGGVAIHEAAVWHLARNIANKIGKRGFAPPYTKGLRMFARGFRFGSAKAERALEDGARRHAEVLGGLR